MFKRIGNLLGDPGNVQDDPWNLPRLPVQEVQVQSLVGELRSHMPLSQKPKHKTEAILKQIQ